ncbi:MAG: hypothetical protein F6K26_20550 [Moorea sp. SIO2I5]|nr:hypothetical protein [Moorena sp. SIO2I5]
MIIKDLDFAQKSTHKNGIFGGASASANTLTFASKDLALAAADADASGKSVSVNTRTDARLNPKFGISRARASADAIARTRRGTSRIVSDSRSIFLYTSR